jgi:hypothetical protein
MNHPLRTELIDARLLTPAIDIESRERLPLHASAGPVLRLDDAARTAAATRVALAQRGVLDTDLESLASSNHRGRGFDHDAMCDGLTALFESRR